MAERKRKAAGKSGAEARICDAVRAAILERRLAPGTKLQEIPLGAFFGVSRTIVRQALRTLAHEGLVALRDRRVAVVARPSAADVAHMFSARRAIEAAVVEQVIARVTRAEIAALRRLVRDEEAAYRTRRPGRRTQALARIPSPAGRAVRQSGAGPLPHRARPADFARRGAVRAARPRSMRMPIISTCSMRSPGAIRKRAARRMIEHLRELERDLDVDAVTGTPSLAAIFGKP